MKRIKNLFNFAKGYYWMIALIILFIIINRLTYSYVPLFTQYLFAFLDKRDPQLVYDVNFPKFVLGFFSSVDPMVLVLKLALVLAIFQSLRFFMYFLESYFRGFTNESIQKKLRNKMYDHIQSLDYQYHNNVDIGDLIQRVTTDIDTIGFFIAERFGEFFRIVATIIFGAIQVYFIQPTMVFVAIAAVPVSGTMSYFYFRYVNKSYKVIEEKEANMTTIIQENLNGSKIVRAFANEAYEINKMNQANLDYSKSARKLDKASALYWAASDIIALLQYSITIIVSVFLTRANLMTADKMIAIIMLIGMLIWPIRGLGRLIGDFGRSLVSTDRIKEVLNLPSEFVVNGKLKPKIKGNIEFKDVSFKFHDSNEHLLNKVNFEILKGETVAVVGRTGSGKSTIVNLLTRMLEVSRGDILLDGIPIKDIEKHYLRKNMGVVLQEPFLYSKTVYENIAIANPSVNRMAVYQAAQVASLERDIDVFEKGYDTIVGEKGTTLSGGQKQRVAIARILLEDKPILVFDDSLSAVDTHTDMMIREALLNKENRATTIIITHRITTAKQADKIIVLDEGKISDIGTHDSLKDKPGLYKKLWDIQGVLEEEFNQMVKGL